MTFLYVVGSCKVKKDQKKMSLYLLSLFHLWCLANA